MGPVPPPPGLKSSRCTPPTLRTSDMQVQGELRRATLTERRPHPTLRGARGAGEGDPQGNLESGTAPRELPVLCRLGGPAGSNGGERSRWSRGQGGGSLHSNTELGSPSRQGPRSEAGAWAGEHRSRALRVRGPPGASCLLCPWARGNRCEHSSGSRDSPCLGSSMASREGTGSFRVLCSGAQRVGSGHWLCTSDFSFWDSVSPSVRRSEPTPPGGRAVSGTRGYTGFPEEGRVAIASLHTQPRAARAG